MNQHAFYHPLHNSVWQHEQPELGPIVPPPPPPLCSYVESDGRFGTGDFLSCMQVVQQVLPPRVCTTTTALGGTIVTAGGTSLPGGGALQHRSAAAGMDVSSGGGGGFSGSGSSSSGGGGDKDEHGGLGEGGGQLQGQQRQGGGLLGVTVPQAATGRLERILALFTGRGTKAVVEGEVVCTVAGVYVPPVEGTNFLAIEVCPGTIRRGTWVCCWGSGCASNCACVYLSIFGKNASTLEPPPQTPIQHAVRGLFAPSSHLVRAVNAVRFPSCLPFRDGPASTSKHPAGTLPYSSITVIRNACTLHHTRARRTCSGQRARWACPATPRWQRWWTRATRTAASPGPH